LNLLYASGSAVPAETGLKISNSGLFTFAKGQTFPGTVTVTDVTGLFSRRRDGNEHIGGRPEHRQ
jgi:hypothetical protein